MGRWEVFTSPNTITWLKSDALIKKEHESWITMWLNEKNNAIYLNNNNNKNLINNCVYLKILRLILINSKRHKFSFSPSWAQEGFSSALEKLVKLELVLFSLKFVWISSWTVNINHRQRLRCICTTEKKKTFKDWYQQMHSDEDRWRRVYLKHL